MLREGREKVGSATTGLIQEKKKKKKKANHRIQCKYCHQQGFSFTPSCTGRNNTKRYFPPLKPVHRSADSRARFCIKFKFLMTAQGKRKENNEIKPLPPGLGWDVTTCLFSPAPVFSQLSTFLCSCGSMIHPFRGRKGKKRGGKGGRKSSSFSLPASSTSGCRHLACLLGPERDLRSAETCFRSRKRLEKRRDVFSGKTLPFPPGQVNERQFQA